MKTAVILHGMPSEEEYNTPETRVQSAQHWLPWLKEQFERQGIPARTPEFPMPYKPDYEAWKRVFETFEIGNETILVGHSCGAGFLARWLSETKTAVGKALLVAPWMDPKPRTLDNGFFEFELDPEVQHRTKITIFYSNDDDSDILQSVEFLKDAWPQAKVITLHNKGHLDFDGLGTREFPELAHEALG